MSEEHKWYLITDGPDCEECRYRAVVGIAKNELGEQIGPTEIERRLNRHDALEEQLAESEKLIEEAWAWVDDACEALDCGAEGVFAIKKNAAALKEQLAEKESDLAAMISWSADNWALNETDFSALPPHLYKQVEALAKEKEVEES